MTFSAGLGAASSAGDTPVWDVDLWDPDKPYSAPGRPLRVAPILMYSVSEYKPEHSYKSWGGVQSHEAAETEAERIAEELEGLRRRAGFPIEILPVALVRTPEDAAVAGATSRDATIIYPATGGGSLLQSIIPPENGLIFVRRRSGPVYYWYEALSVRYLRTDRPDFEAVRGGSAPALSVHDVVVDDLDELLWRLQALYAIHNLKGARVVALGGEWGKYAPEAPQLAREKYGMEIIDVPYEDFAPRMAAALADSTCMGRAEAWTRRYLSMPGTALECDRRFVVNAFVVYGLFKALMKEYNAAAFTIKSCMGSIMPMSKTTACLPLSLLNDEGLAAFCESDFVMIPAGILLYYLCGTPVFLHNSTFPHGGLVTCAHCTAPRRMDGVRYEPARILTHYESDFGAAPKVEMPIGRRLTFVNPEYATGRWLGMRGTVEDNPFYEICRSQQDVRIEGPWKRLLSEARDSHWLMVYGDHLEQAGYAAQRLGIDWEALEEPV